ncbi:MAG: ParB/RepB/Spo0J family partition protein [Candidatus Bathyarchaeia archaeon]
MEERKPRKKALFRKEAQNAEKVSHGETLSTSKVLSVKLSDIIVPPNAVLRGEETLELDGLTKTLKRDGVIQPVGVKLKGDKYELVFGYRRFMAAKKAGLKEVPALVFNIINDKQAAILRGLENFQRKNLNPIEEAEYFAKLQRNFGMSTREIAHALGLDKAHVSRMLQLLKLHPDVQECVYRKRLPVKLALMLLKVKDPKHQAELANKYALGEISRQEFLARARLTGKLAEHVRPREPSPNLGERSFTCFICGLQRPLTVRGGQILSASLCHACAQWLIEEIIKIRREKGAT